MGWPKPTHFSRADCTGPIIFRAAAAAKPGICVPKTQMNLLTIINDIYFAAYWETKG
jgi:hypothetical protein